jgi:hypothetical protein
MMKHFFAILILLVPCVSSFIANTKVITTSVSARQPLFLQVQQIHDHRDTLIKLDDPIMSITDDSVKIDKRVHNFTNHIAPIVLALYFLGHYLNTYQAPMTDGRVHIDPMFGGGILIGVGLYLLRSSIDATFLSPA